MRDTEGDDSLLAVVAHGLLNAAHPALMAAEALQRDDVPDDLRAELLALVAERTADVVETLHDLMRGIPPAVLEVLDNLSVDVRSAAGPSPEGDAGPPSKTSRSVASGGRQESRPHEVPSGPSASFSKQP